MLRPLVLTLALAAAFPLTANAAVNFSNAVFQNGLTLDGGALDLSAGSATERRIGYFSDIYYDRARNEWWGLSDRGPGGGTISYETRIQRFTLDVAANGAISNFQVAQTIKFTQGGVALNGLAPNPNNVLGRAFDPEGMVINPRNGHLLVSDEYGPSVYEFDRNGQFVKAFSTPANLVPKVGAAVDYNATSSTLTAGRENNRGLEGLAISPDGKYAYAMLQNGAVQDGTITYKNGVQNGLTRSEYTRIVKYDTDTGAVLGQFAYKLDRSGQGQGISALVALGEDKFLVLERNNRGVGVGADLATADKSVYQIDLSTATDVSGIALPASGNLPAGVSAVAKGAKVIDLGADKLAALGNKTPEKWEGLAVGPQLANGKYLVLAGTDNDYSVTQNGSNVQFDVYYRFSDADPYKTSIQCPIGAVSNCVWTADSSAATLTGDYKLLPGVLHAYTATIDGYVPAVPEPSSYALLMAGLLATGAAVRRRRA